MCVQCSAVQCSAVRSAVQCWYHAKSACRLSSVLRASCLRPDPTAVLVLVPDSNHSLDDPEVYPDDWLVHSSDQDLNPYYRPFGSLEVRLGTTCPAMQPSPQPPQNAPAQGRLDACRRAAVRLGAAAAAATYISCRTGSGCAIRMLLRPSTQDSTKMDGNCAVAQPGYGRNEMYPCINDQVDYGMSPALPCLALLALLACAVPPVPGQAP